MTVCGAAGGIGQPLSLLLKQNPLVTELSLYDIVHTPGVAADLSHIDTKSKTAGFIGADQLGDSLKGEWRAISEVRLGYSRVESYRTMMLPT